MKNNQAAGRTAQAMEAMVVMTRLELYNAGVPCGPKAIIARLGHLDLIDPLPSNSTISRILARNGLTHARTGKYDGDIPSWLPESEKQMNIGTPG